MLHKEDRKERIQGEDPFHRQGSTTKDHTKISHREDGKKQHNDKSLTRKVLQPKTTELYRTEKIQKKQHKVNYLRAKVPQLKTTERLPTKKIENKQHKAKYVSGARFHNGTQLNGMGQRRSKTNSTTNTCNSQSRFYNRKHQKDCEQRRSKRNSNKAEYFTGKVPQPKTRQIYPPEKMEKNRTRLIISQPRFHNRRQKDIYWTEKKTKVNITASFIADKVLTEVKKKIKSRRKDTNRIDEEKVSKQKLTGKRN